MDNNSLTLSIWSCGSRRAAGKSFDVIRSTGVIFSLRINGISQRAYRDNELIRSVEVISLRLMSNAIYL